MGVVGNKSWAGSTLADRQSERRAKLLATALTLLASGGGQAVSVRAVCRGSGVTERYFYENFADREALVAAVFDQLSTEIMAAVTLAVSTCERSSRAIAEAAVDAVVGLTIDEPEKGRALFVAPVSDPMLYGKVDEVGRGLVAMIREQLPGRAPAAHRDLVASSLAGALAHLFHQYVAGELRVSRRDFVQHCVELLLTVAQMPAPGRGDVIPNDAHSRQNV